MKKKLLILLALLTACVFCFAAGAEEKGTAIDEEHFPDGAFRKAVSKYDLDGDGFLSAEEAEGVVSICVNNSGIKTIRGVEYLTGLEELDCANNKLTELDVSRIAGLKELMCGNNRLTELDLSGNPELTGLYCWQNRLTELDVSSNLMLENLYCWDNQLTKLDVSRNTKLTGLDCGDNRIEDLDISMLTGLTCLDISGYPIQEINLRIYPDLEQLRCAHCGLTELDTGGNPKLTWLECSDNQLTALSLAGNPELTYVRCERNRLTELDLSNNPWIIWLHCSGNPLETLDIRPCKELAMTVGRSEPAEEAGVLEWKRDMNGAVTLTRAELSVDKSVNLVTGIGADAGTETGDPANGIRGDMPVYCVPENGKYYHLDPNCWVSNPLRYCCTYAELEKEPYCDLIPCEACSAPLERMEETPYKNFGDAQGSGYSGSSFHRTYCAAAVERNGEYYRVITMYDEKARKLIAESFAVDYDEDPERYREASNRFFDYCVTLPVSYEEKITAVPAGQEELDGFAGKTLGEVLREGFSLEYHNCEYGTDVVFELEKGFYSYRFTMDATPEEYRERVETERFNDLTVKSVRIGGLAYKAYDLEYRADGTPVPRDGDN